MSLTVFDESPIAVTAKLVITGRMINQDECPDHRLMESPATAKTPQRGSTESSKAESNG